jgi:hypothetical protein
MGMPGVENLVILLSGINVNDRDRYRAKAVAEQLVKDALQERWNIEPRQQIIIEDSRDRLWDGYMKRRLNSSIKPQDAARHAIFDEISFLNQLLNKKTGYQGQE